VFTAGYLDELMRRPWEENHPASPHKLLNAYVHQLTNFTPLDGDSFILGQEADVEPIGIDGFRWTTIEQGASLCWFG
jgi:hypothetical protein